MMHGETGKLLELREELEKEMKRISEDFISPRYSEVECYLDKIREMKSDYQDEIEDFIDKYIDFLHNPKVLDDWLKEVMDVATVVKNHANIIRTRALQLAARPPPKPANMIKFEETEKAALTTWLKDFTDRHGIGETDEEGRIKLRQLPTKTRHSNSEQYDKVSKSYCHEAPLKVALVNSEEAKEDYSDMLGVFTTKKDAVIKEEKIVNLEEVPVKLDSQLFPNENEHLEVQKLENAGPGDSST